MGTDGFILWKIYPLLKIGKSCLGQADWGNVGRDGAVLAWEVATSLWGIALRPSRKSCVLSASYLGHAALLAAAGCCEHASGPGLLSSPGVISDSLRKDEIVN